MHLGNLESNQELSYPFSGTPSILRPFRALQNFFFLLITYNIDKGDNSLLKHFDRNPNIR